MSKYVLTKSILCLGLIVPLLLLSQLLLAQTSLPTCTAEIMDVDGDQTNDNDGADGIIDIDKDGDGLIEICDLEGLSEMRYQLDGSSYTTSADATTITQGCPTAGCRGYELVKDLDFNADASYRTTSNKVTWTMGDGWSPIGSGSNRFSGVFEGNGHTIAHLYIDQSSSYRGLFSITTNTAQINNIKLSDVNITGIGSNIGSLIGRNFGSIINSDVTGTVAGTGKNFVGGLVGDNNGQITLCVANVIVTGGARIGGLAGTNAGVISESRASGNVMGNIVLGGLVGWNEGSIANTVANVIVTGGARIGGLAGTNAGVISESRASGNVMGNIVLGGLVGWNEGSIANTYATGNVSGNIQVGGLVGTMFSNSSRITNSYAIGKPSGGQPSGSSNIGGLVGSGINVGVVTASYWDTEASMQASRDDDAEFAKTTAELKFPIAPGTTSTAIYYGWSTDIWDFGSTSTYPLLRSAGIAVDGSEVVIDKDGNGLIEIYDLEGLNEMRYQLDGSGHKTSADATKSIQGCPESGCIGYELMKDLDFNADASYLTTSNKVTWTTGDGWSPIGSNSNRFSGVFEGNGYTIANLYIDRNSNDIGLFAVTADTAKIQNIRLLNAAIQGAIDVGSLVGSNFGLIINSDVTTATIVGNSQIGGLVGSNFGLIINSDVTTATIVGNSQIGGLVGANRGDIISSFAYTDVIGRSNVGGLVGDNTSNIANTYAAGTVSSTQTVSHAGGLVGVNGSSALIRNSYTVSRLMPLTDGSSQVGGLVGDDSGSIIASYWDKTVNADLMTSDGDGAKTTAELKTPTAPGATSADTYYGWRTTAWDFGDNTHYPTLYYATTDSITVSACADNPPPSSALPRCGSRIPNQTVRNLTPPIELPPLAVSDIQLSVQPAANDDGTINEGSTATITFEVSGGTDDYQYEFKIDDAEYTSFEPPFMYSIADDFIAADTTSPTVTLTIRVSDQSDEIAAFEYTEELHIRKINNGSADINLNITNTTLTAIVGADPDGDPNPATYTYRWQSRPLGEDSPWTTIGGENDTSYTISGDLASASGEFRVQITYTDGQGYSESPISNAIRYTPTSELQPLMVSDIQLSVQPAANDDGTINEGSTATITFEVSGGTDVYQYESKIDDAAGYTSFEPPFIYSIADDLIATDATTQTVRVTIKVSDQSAEIEDVEHTEELHILKTNKGSADINLSITNTTLTATIGTDPDGNPNPLSYTYQWQTRPLGEDSPWVTIGGENDTSYTISGDLASASGEFRVQVTYTDGQGYSETSTSNAIRYIPTSELQPLMVSDIQLSVQPPANADGTINEGSTATITFEVSGGTDDYQYASKIDDAAEYTSFELPFIYSISDDFIAADTTSQIVTLTIRVSDQSANIEASEHTAELHIRKINNGPADINLSIRSATLTATIGADPDGDATTPNYQYQWQTNTGSGWMDIASTTDTSYTISGNLAETSGEFRVQVMYTDGQGYSEMPISNAIPYTPTSELQPLTVSDIQLSAQPPANADGTINEGSMATLTFEVSGGTGDYQYASKIDDAAYTSFQLPFMYSIADDFIATDATSQTVTLTIRVSDQTAEIEAVEHTEELHIRKTNNGSADITITEMNGTLSATVGTDPDGDPNPLSYIYQWQSNTGSGWMNIAPATNNTYAITADGEFRVQVMYTDGQGYPETSTSNVISYTQPDSSGLRIRTKVFLEGPLR